MDERPHFIDQQPLPHRQAIYALAINTMKNTAPPRAFRGQGYTGAEPPNVHGQPTIIYS